MISLGFRFSLATVLALCWSSLSLAALTGQYLFEDGPSSTAFDTSGYGRNGANTNGPVYVPGLYPGSNYALQLNAAGPNSPNVAAAQSVILPDNTDFVRNARGATLMAWIRLDGGSLDRDIVSISSGNSSSSAPRARLAVTTNGGTTRALAIGSQVDGNTSSGVLSFQLLNVGQTYFLAGVLDYTNHSVAIYINGVLNNSSSIPTWNGLSTNAANRFAEIGAYPPPSLAPGSRDYFPGAIDGVRIFDHALTASQILNLYQNPDNVPEPGALLLTGLALASLAIRGPVRRR